MFAYILAPLVDRLCTLSGHRLARFLAVIVVELLLLLALTMLALLVVLVFYKELPQIREQLPLVFDKLDNAVRPWLTQFGIRLALDLDSLKQQALGYINANYSGAMASLFSSLRLGGSVALASWPLGA